MFQSTKISGNSKSATKIGNKNQHLKIKFKNHSSIFFFEIFGPRYCTTRSMSPGDMGNFERYEMGAFPLRDGEHFPLRDEQISISSADRNEKLARASAYPLGWASDSSSENP